MKCAIIDYTRKFKFEGSRGRVIIDGAELGDPRVTDILDDLAEMGVENVTLTFEDGSTGPSESKV